METINRTIAIGDSTKYRMRCSSFNEYSSLWILEHFVDNKFLWWKWSEWETLIVYTNYGGGETDHIFNVRKRHEEDDQYIMYAGEAELDFLYIEYK